MLNAAVGLELADAAGLASQEASAGRVSVNAGDAALRLITEDVGAQWQTENFGAEGSLYAAQPGGDWTYRGDDPAAYDGAFVQLSGDDLAPLTTFLDFVNNSDDATFASELPSRLDTDAFATYLAVQDLLRNINDINGPGNNADLFYDPSTGLMTVVTPDLSGAFSARGGQPGGPPGGPDGSLPEGFPQAGQFPGGSLPEGFPQAGQFPGGSLPEGFPQDGQFPGGSLPEGFPQDGQFPGGSLPDGVPQNGGRFQRSNALVDRFLANDTFHQLYESKLTELTATLYTSGTAAGLLDQWVTVLSEQASDVVSPDDVTARAAELTEQFTAPETTSGSAPTADDDDSGRLGPLTPSPAGAPARRRGRTTTNRHPACGAVVSVIVPPWASTIDLAIAKPSPDPPVRRARDASPR